MFDGVARWRPHSYDERDVSDKPEYVSSRPRLSARTKARIDEERRDQLEALRAVDEAVGRLRDALADTRRLADTIFVFASDNGLFRGEHRLERKDAPYEESIRIPLVVRWDRLPSTPRVSGRLVLNLDLPVTLAGAAGTTLPGAGGASLMPLLTGAGGPWRTRALLEHYQGQTVPSYCGIRSTGAVFVHYATGEEEYYRLNVDPDQLVNRIGSARWAPHIEELRTTARYRCAPLPPGMPAF
jgi:arylsulfatase A-like enzyme